MIQYQKTYVQNLNRLLRNRKNEVIFQRYGCACDITAHDVINSKPIYLKNFVEHQPAWQIWCFHDFFFSSYIPGIFVLILPV